METYFIECSINKYKDKFIFERDDGSISKYKYIQINIIKTITEEFEVIKSYGVKIWLSKMIIKTCYQ